MLACQVSLQYVTKRCRITTSSHILHKNKQTPSLHLLGRVALVRGVAACSRQTFPWTICRSARRSVRTCVGLSVCPVHCGKTADLIRMPFGITGPTGPGMRQVVRFVDRSTGRGTFGGEFGARHCNQWRLYGERVRQCLNRPSCGLGWCVRWAEAMLY